MPEDLRQCMGPCLNALAVMTRVTWSADTLLSNDSDRQTECNDELAKHLNYPSDIMFEAGTFAQIRDTQQQLHVHTDVLNDKSVGYEKTLFISFIILEDDNTTCRITVIGYNRRCCHH